MKIMKVLTIALASSLALISTALAHHSIAAIFNQQQQITIAGEVVEFQFVNPHANLRLKVTDENGSEEIWDIEMDGRLNLTNGNITLETFQPGEQLVVLGFPPHVESPNLFFLSATREDGSIVLPPRINRGNALDSERERRRLERTNNN